ncbi:MAG: ABC transporter ATP-binding protein [Massiliimalia sp.]|jgi:ABC-2 type transport system ATP-binding protein
MIEICETSKQFGGFTALNKITCTIENESIYGLVGSNGAGKSTLLRLIAGVYKADHGVVLVDGENIFENIPKKDCVFYLSDELYFPAQSTILSMAKFYAGYYSRFDWELFQELCRIFPLDIRKSIHTFSKGMQRQAGLILALSTRPKYLLLDEAFDGLDPVVRNAVRRILAESVAKDGSTILISSHNLRELEDLCDHIALLHQGGILLEKDIDSLKMNLCKFHCAFHKAPGREAFEALHLLKFEKKGNLITFTAEGPRDEIETFIEGLNPLFQEALPLTLEEVFIQEMEEAGYDFKHLTFES